MKKIRVNRVDPRCGKINGLFGGGCSTSVCNDECCEYGCDVDLATLKLITRHRDLIEPLIGAKIEDCFSTELKKDDDYIGGHYRETAVRKTDNRCAFHLIGKRGCSLFYLWGKEGLPKKIIPTICRIYPLTWHRGRLFLDDIREVCKCMEKPPKGMEVPSLFETQKKEVRALFDIQDKKEKKRR